jgi:hypothetical protein
VLSSGIYRRVVRWKSATCHFLSRGCLARLTRSWRWIRYIPRKRRLTFNGLHGAICQKFSLRSSVLRCVTRVLKFNSLENMCRPVLWWIVENYVCVSVQSHSVVGCTVKKGRALVAKDGYHHNFIVLGSEGPASLIPKHPGKINLDVVLLSLSLCTKWIFSKPFPRRKPFGIPCH